MLKAMLLSWGTPVIVSKNLVMGNDIRDSTDTNEEHSSLKLSVYSTFISKLDKTQNQYL